MYGHTTWPPPCGTTGAGADAPTGTDAPTGADAPTGTDAPTGADARTGTVPARTGRWNR
ncbi:hypothetical protein ACFY0G_37150 [Streptomyces sp. NPDC001552]|uniref:hypothetical protein n=1 Tax=Streptomyces sp. NPDC001552 TaxID=3364587 RepID=UPI0036BE7F87